MKKVISLLAIILFMVLVSCDNVASRYSGHRVQLSSKEEVYAEFDMSIFRGIVPNDMTYREVVNILGEPNEFAYWESSTDEIFNDPVYYSNKGKLLIDWGEEDDDEKIDLVTFESFQNTPLLTRDFVHNPEKLGIPLDKVFAVYVDDLLYFIVDQEDGKILDIAYFYIKEGKENLFTPDNFSRAFSKIIPG